MERINDERLQLRNLKNIRIVYIIQTFGILAILAYDLVTKGMDRMTENPLWAVFMISAVVNAYLMMNISVDHEKQTSPEKGLYISLAVVGVLSIASGAMVTLLGSNGMGSGFLIGGIILVCSLVPVIYIYVLRKRKIEDEDEEELSS
ncbi:hypothetical protein CEH05_06735 [Halobacillus halophilus]|uniref:Uncharacterized protein n=1 Tax=Halobacillus halophilus (strain ATCC 35676 / DSM 2266 / JCM 20832 / KCTC 3685 / LMG 17431 / NBRC 102448 / NCIMB 2269) TaxID=866895 RepID=I0JKL9_HALH3|nr:hypothetical protein [Halobacillus halophilus]ASF38826.1 hypothetical protein CEH05_06735 [Halobacillus halophilus]CCG44688.1 hypothetical protein HBHAL_2342 [Halobacillus halophilus DSM 2266]